MQACLGKSGRNAINGLTVTDTKRISWTRVDPQGRVVIPAELRRDLEIAPGSPVAFLLEDGLLKLMTVRQGIERAQRIVGKHTKGKSIVDELIADRRAEAARE
jgi:AbrB family looped-hinge helix DNA binding protein